ncbi:MAG: PIN domain nuclease [Acidobacteria bacterium]|nr:MAG: PIN domain nuclease [Acidobacteriota bacterium]
MTRYLLDTQPFLWWLREDPMLGEKTSGIIADADNEIYVSAVSLWEMSIKKGIGKLKLPNLSMSEVVVSQGFLPLPIDFVHAEKAGVLPKHHRDPFDRMLVAQAQIEGLILITKDERIFQCELKLLNALD